LSWLARRARRNFAREVGRVAVKIVNRGAAVYGDYSAGRYTPAVPAEHAFAVLNRQGSPVILAHDAFEVAFAVVTLAAGWMTLEGLEAPLKYHTDAERAAERAEERRRDYWLFGNSY
jgi:hypothetical protein